MANAEKIRAVVEKIIVDPASWDQDAVANVTWCGTTFCIAGHAAVLEGWTLFNPRLGWLVPPGETRYASTDKTLDFAQDVLGLTVREAASLFYWMPENYPDHDFTPAGLVARVQAVTGVNCWDLIAKHGVTV